MLGWGDWCYGLRWGRVSASEPAHWPRQGFRGSTDSSRTGLLGLLSQSTTHSCGRHRSLLSPPRWRPGAHRVAHVAAFPSLWGRIYLVAWWFAVFGIPQLIEASPPSVPSPPHAVPWVHPGTSVTRDESPPCCGAKSSEVTLFPSRALFRGTGGLEFNTIQPLTPSLWKKLCFSGFFFSQSLQQVKSQSSWASGCRPLSVGGRSLRGSVSCWGWRGVISWSFSLKPFLVLSAYTAKGISMSTYWFQHFRYANPDLKLQLSGEAERGPAIQASERIQAFRSWKDFIKSKALTFTGRKLEPREVKWLTQLLSPCASQQCTWVGTRTQPPCLLFQLILPHTVSRAHTALLLPAMEAMGPLGLTRPQVPIAFVMLCCSLRVQSPWLSAHATQLGLFCGLLILEFVLSPWALPLGPT